MANTRRWGFSYDFIDTSFITPAIKASWEKNRKRPLFMNDYIREVNHTHSPNLAARKIRNYKFEDEDQLNTLSELDRPELKNFKRAYRLNAMTDSIICFDIESTTSPEIIDVFSKIPAHFSEYSTNNGLHLFYKINLKDVSEDLRYFLTKTVYKVKDLNKPDPEKNEYEIIMNDHWITFTNKVNTNQIVPLSEPVPDIIMDLLENAAKLSKEKEVNLTQIQLTTTEPSDMSLKIYSWLKHKPRISEINETRPDEYNDDLSSYTSGVASKVASYVQYQCANLDPAMMFKENFTPINATETDKIMACYLLVVDAIPYRPKHDSLRNNMTWLLQTVVNSYQFIVAVQSQNQNN